MGVRYIKTKIFFISKGILLYVQSSNDDDEPSKSFNKCQLALRGLGREIYDWLINLELSTTQIGLISTSKI
jgi:hypothetical protein